jgi:hypothetical protein
MLDERPRNLMAMKDSNTESGSTIMTMSADRAWNKNTRADDRNDERLLNERVGQGLDGSEDQFRAVVGEDAIRQAKRGNLGVECADDLQRIRADAHHHDAAHRLPGAVPVRGTAANLRPVADSGYVAEPDGRAAGADCDHALFEILQVLDVAAATQDVFATGEFEHACADFRVGVADRPRNVRHRQPEAHQPIRIDDDLVLSLEAAKRRDFRDTGDGLERRADHEILQRAQFGEVKLMPNIE